MSTMATISALPDINWSTTVEWGTIPPESDRGVSTVYTSFSPSGVIHVWSWDLEQWVELVFRSPADDTREAELLAENERLRAALEFEKREAAHWKANHANRVEAARVLIERPDTPLERVDAYHRYLRALQVAQDIVEQGKSRPLPGMEVIQQLIGDPKREELLADAADILRLVLNSSRLLTEAGIRWRINDFMKSYEPQ